MIQWFKSLEKKYIEYTTRGKDTPLTRFLLLLLVPLGITGYLLMTGFIWANLLEFSFTFPELLLGGAFHIVVIGVPILIIGAIGIVFINIICWIIYGVNSERHSEIKKDKLGIILTVISVVLSLSWIIWIPVDLLIASTRSR